MYFTTHTGLKTRRRNTKGWDLLFQWKDGSNDWIALKDVKESNPIEIAQYVLNTKFSDEPAFAWWTDTIMNQKKRLIQKVKSKYWMTTQKFGVRIPKAVVEALSLDAANGTTLWKDAILQEMKNVRIAFEPCANVSDVPKGYQKIDCYMIFDIKLSENFRRKARFVAGGHTTITPAFLTYYSVFYRESLRIALLLTALHGKNVKFCDIYNAYLSADCL